MLEQVNTQALLMPTAELYFIHTTTLLPEARRNHNAIKLVLLHLCRCLPGTDLGCVAVIQL